MYFDSFQAAMAMGGHGVYVWSAYGITALVIAQLVLWPSARKKRLVAELRGEQRRRAGASQETGQSDRESS